MHPFFALVQSMVKFRTEKSLVGLILVLHTLIKLVIADVLPRNYCQLYNISVIKRKNITLTSYQAFGLIYQNLASAMYGLVV